VKILIALMASLLVSGAAVGEVYKWMDEKGKVHFGDQKPASGKVEEVELNVKTYTSVSHQATTVHKEKIVVMYSTARCGYCKQAREYFRKNNIRFTEYDIGRDKSARRRFKQMGAKGVPVILYAGKRMNGFSIKGFKRLYR